MRNNKLVYSRDGLGWWFVGSLGLIPIWFVSFSQGTTGGFVLAFIAILGCLVCSVMMWWRVFRFCWTSHTNSNSASGVNTNATSPSRIGHSSGGEGPQDVNNATSKNAMHLPLNWVENLSMKIGFSIYSGWLGSATILNAFILLKHVGAFGENEWIKNDPSQNSNNSNISNTTTTTTTSQKYAQTAAEQNFAVFVLWMVFGLYNLGSWVGRNPIFGAVLLWTLTAIRGKQVQNKAEEGDANGSSSIL
jgi:hypothetical protein